MAHRPLLRAAPAVSALLVALLGVATNLATPLLPATWTWARNPVLVWLIVFMLFLLVVVLAILQALPSQPDGPQRNGRELVIYKAPETKEVSQDFKGTEGYLWTGRGKEARPISEKGSVISRSRTAAY